MAGLEELIIGHFVANPEESFVTSGLSSYERLLAHTCCMYNHLVSESKFIIVSSRFDFLAVHPNK